MNDMAPGIIERSVESMRTCPKQLAGGLGDVGRS